MFARHHCGCGCSPSAQAGGLALEREAGEDRLSRSCGSHHRNLWSARRFGPRIERGLEQPHHHRRTMHHAIVHRLRADREVRRQAPLCARPHHSRQLAGCLLSLQLLLVRWLAGSHLLPPVVLAGHGRLQCVASRAPARPLHCLWCQWLAVRRLLHEAHRKVLLDHRHCLLQPNDWPLAHPPLRRHHHAEPPRHDRRVLHLLLLERHRRNHDPDRPQYVPVPTSLPSQLTPHSRQRIARRPSRRNSMQLPVPLAGLRLRRLHVRHSLQPGPARQPGHRARRRCRRR